MELELKHLAPYLPYELKIVDEFGVTRILSWKNQSYDSIEVGLNQLLFMKDYKYNIRFKPYLRSFEDFEYADTMLIESHIGNQWCDAYDEYFELWFGNILDRNHLVLQAPYQIMLYFFENHYDVFDLIENGLAVDINTIEK